MLKVLSPWTVVDSDFVRRVSLFYLQGLSAEVFLMDEPEGWHSVCCQDFGDTRKNTLPFTRHFSYEEALIKTDEALKKHGWYLL